MDDQEQDQGKQQSIASQVATEVTQMDETLRMDKSMNQNQRSSLDLINLDFNNTTKTKRCWEQSKNQLQSDVSKRSMQDSKIQSAQKVNSMKFNSNIKRFESQEMMALDENQQ